MSGPTSPTAQRSALSPEMIILAGCVIAILTFGPRSAIGAFQLPILSSTKWNGEIFSFALAIQNLLWGVGQPIAGALADRYGSMRVLMVGGLLYAAGLILMSVSTTPASFNLSAGVLIGFGLSGSSFNLVLGAFGKLLPENRRSMAFGLGTAAGSFGQFLFSPIAGGMIQSYGWQTTSVVFGLLMFAIIPLAMAVASKPAAPQVANSSAVEDQTARQALVEAFGHRSYVLLVLGFFTCGFQLAFVTVHFQRYVVEAGLRPEVGYWAFALVGIFNIVGSLSAGWAGTRMPKRWILSGIYLARSIATVMFILLPPTALSAYVFGAVTGLLWLSTVPPTSALVSQMFGTRHFAMLFGFAFFSHQVGGFLGVLLGGILREQTGSYMIVWWLSIGFGIASALINLPIVEKAVPRKDGLVTA